MSIRQKPIVALCYDFDGTLAPGNMQEYAYIPRLDMTKEEFWAAVGRRARAQNGDAILTYMKLMVEKANADPSRNIQLTREAFARSGRQVKLFPGVEQWFGRLNHLADDMGVHLEHYIISSGIREMIEGTPIAGEFKRIYASSFMYNQHGVADWPALVLNYTTKTQYLFRVNKGLLDVWDNAHINDYVEKSKRPVPFEQIIYLGDGSTDVPCMKLVKSHGGHSAAVYRARTAGRKATAQRLLREDRVNFIAPADYRPGKLLEKQVQAVIKKIVADLEVQGFEAASRRGLV